MAEPHNLVLSDKSVYPSDEVLFSFIGDKKAVWQGIINYAEDKIKDITREWRFYNDGKQWLFKMQHKKKTIFWAGVMKDTFRVTFYFGNKAEPVIMESSLPMKMKDDFMKGRRFGQLRPISIIVSESSDLENICKLIDIKTNLK
ncbi:MAG: DUF3788 family protein [Bacteroidales bacterium]